MIGFCQAMLNLLPTPLLRLPMINMEARWLSKCPKAILK
jgi:hypothetical protein